jgi:UDP-N-acetylmuramate--alanine ligase
MHYHIVGIAGAGMSAVAHILLDQGHTVSGSDLSSNRLTAALAERGATLYVGHNAAYVGEADAVVATAAARPDHPELAAARAANIPLLKRGDLWRDWSQQRLVIAVAGTHGKTTTTAMIAWIFSQANRQPGFMIGGESLDLGSNARWGDPLAPLVIEADEYDRAFLALRPRLAVITNVEWDHPDIYPTAEAYCQAFAEFATNSEGAVIAYGDVAHDDCWSHEVRRSGLALRTYGLHPDNDYQAVLTAEGQAAFTVRYSKAALHSVHKRTGDAALGMRYHVGIPGIHNIKNALAAIAVADAAGLDSTLVAQALRSFRGTARRFELRGEVAGVTVVDDYAHHPTEVRATLAAARARYGQRRLVAYVQPHTYSRTEALLDDWPAAFADADVVLVGAIYAAREKDEDGSRAALVYRIVESIAATHGEASYVGNVPEAATAVCRMVQPGDVLLTMGAGDGNQIGEAVLSYLQAGSRND